MGIDGRTGFARNLGASASRQTSTLDDGGNGGGSTEQSATCA